MRHPVLHSLAFAPIVPMLTVVQLPTIADETTPGWVAVFLLGAWVMHSILDKAGKLPWSHSGEVPHLTVVELDNLRELLADPSKADKVYDIVTREDSERPGYYMVWTTDRERRQLAKQMEEHAKLITATISTLDAMKRSLASLHNKVDELSQRRQA